MTRRGLGGRHRARAPARSGQINQLSGEWTDWSGIATQKDTGPKYYSPIPVSEWPLRPERVCASIEAPAACSEREDSRTKGAKSMSVKLTTREMGDVIIVDTSGKLTLGEGTNTLRAKIRELVAGGSRRIVLNLADVTYMDSSGLVENRVREAGSHQVDAATHSSSSVMTGHAATARASTTAEFPPGLRSAGVGRTILEDPALTAQDRHS